MEQGTGVRERVVGRRRLPPLASFLLLVAYRLSKFRRLRSRFLHMAFFFRGCLGALLCLGFLHKTREALHAARGIHQLLLPSVERVARRTHFCMDLGFRGTNRERVPTGAGDCRPSVRGMDAVFHTGRMYGESDRSSIFSSRLLSPTPSFLPPTVSRRLHPSVPSAMIVALIR